MILALIVVTLLVTNGCASITPKARHQPAQSQSQPDRYGKLVYAFKVTTYNATTFEGIPFHIRCRFPNKDQGFLLSCRQLPIIACGYLDPDGIVWTNWILEKPTTKPGQTLTFELWTIGPDKVGVTEVSLLADFMFGADGSDPKNPPEE